MPRALLVVACLLRVSSTAFGFQMEPQALHEKLVAPEFARVLTEVLAAVKLGTVPQVNTKSGAPVAPPVPAVFVGMAVFQQEVPFPKLILPAAACLMSALLYRCEWETKTNKYSVAVVQDDLSAAVAAALPNTWKRERGENYAVRYTNFTDPTGEIVISVTCPTSDGNFPLDSFAARLTIHRAGLPIR